jgi:RecB family exonuclease
MRYIDADKFIAELEQEKTEALEFEDGVAVYEIEHTMNLIGMQPTADVVPKSEVEELKKKLAETEVELMNVCLEKTNCDDMIQYILDFYFRRKVMDVFEEIEFEIRQLDFDREETRAIAIEGIIAKCKKKYTEVNDEKQS